MAEKKKKMDGQYFVQLSVDKGAFHLCNMGAMEFVVTPAH